MFKFLKYEHNLKNLNLNFSTMTFYKTKFLDFIELYFLGVKTGFKIKSITTNNSALLIGEL